MAHQTFYIDIDEEITSIVERLRRARASEIILVVPKRALLIQSIVNLRILKREADEARLQLMMVTQDKLGKILIEKAGIFVQQKMDNIADEEIEMKEEGQPMTEHVIEEEHIKSGRNRLDKIGSSSYFDAYVAAENIKAEQVKLKVEKADEQEPEKEVLINKELVLSVGKETERKLLVRPSFDMKPAASAPIVPSSAPIAPSPAPRSFVSSGNNLNFQDKKIEDFFYQPRNVVATQPKKAPIREIENYNLPVKVHKWLWTLSLTTILFLVGIAIYLFVPKAAVIVSVKLDSQSVDAQMTGRVGLSAPDVDGGIIPAQLVSVAQEVSESYAATGSQLVSNQKAHGTVIIYNEYSSSPQPLVATTRFLTADGKLFRLIKDVIVPGTNKVDGQIKNGEVVAEIAADEAGDSFNIDPTTFNIPGFKSSGVKYDKIYAKSTSAMTGGGNGASESKVITNGDIASAKSKILTELNGKIEEEMKKTGIDDAVVLDGATAESDVTYKLSNSADDVADSFQITANAEAKALIVSQKDIHSLIAEMLEKNSDGKKIDVGSIKVDFSRADVDFASGTINIKFHAIGKIVPSFTADSIKKAILGKNEEQIKAYLSDLSNVQKVELNYWPSFINGRIPFLGSRVNVTIDGI